MVFFLILNCCFEFKVNIKGKYILILFVIMKFKRYLRVVYDVEIRLYERLICDWDIYFEFFLVMLLVIVESMVVLLCLFGKCFR